MCVCVCVGAVERRRTGHRQWWSVEGQDTGSGVSKMETTAAADNFQHTQNPHAHA